MTTEKYDYTDSTGYKRIVRIVGDESGNNFERFVVTVQDVTTDDRIEGVKMTDLLLRDSE